MDTFEDENPFEAEGDRIVHSETSSSSKLNILGTPSPSIQSAVLSPTSDRTFSPPGQSIRPSPLLTKNDHWFQSGDDVEILVSPISLQYDIKGDQCIVE
jgi:hypothetical protein